MFVFFLPSFWGIFNVFNFARAFLLKNAFWKMKHFRIEKLKESTRHDHAPFRQSLSAIIVAEVSATAEQQRRKKKKKKKRETTKKREREI